MDVTGVGIVVVIIGLVSIVLVLGSLGTKPA